MLHDILRNLPKFWICIQAAILATCSPGDTLFVARNCHVSVFSGLINAGAVPHWIFPETDTSCGIAVSLSVAALEEALENSRKSGVKPKAVIVVSPTYYGTCSDVEGPPLQNRLSFCFCSTNLSPTILTADTNALTPNACHKLAIPLDTHHKQSFCQVDFEWTVKCSMQPQGGEFVMKTSFELPSVFFSELLSELYWEYVECLTSQTGKEFMQ